MPQVVTDVYVVDEAFAGSPMLRPQTTSWRWSRNQESTIAEINLTMPKIFPRHTLLARCLVTVADVAGSTGWEHRVHCGIIAWLSMQKNTGWDCSSPHKFMRGAGAANSINSRVVHTSASSRTKTVPRLKAEGHLIPWRMTVSKFEACYPSAALAQHHKHKQLLCAMPVAEGEGAWSCVILDSGLAPYDPTNNSYNYTHQTSPGPN
jgi:hypothetical protein